MALAPRLDLKKNPIFLKNRIFKPVSKKSKAQNTPLTTNGSKNFSSGIAFFLASFLIHQTFVVHPSPFLRQFLLRVHKILIALVKTI
ncbi:hypothetical protein PN36_07780 [Candidatus Thiomargarita nelsonii]|uniref:Uncharacterized protein n=1 Tax=Candidatus Thiomargarita nelsonii TaxID=1003181 RepID=A0A4E0QS12_9GAMM|nr:hypothetical protein PN36_07780 [Candidatus Thiomargarita nelsonii]